MWPLRLGMERIGAYPATMPRGGDRLTAQDWPKWWDWELELSPHLLKRMEDRRFTEIHLRDMLEKAIEVRPDVVPGRWVVETRFRRRLWEVIVEPDISARVLLVITAYARGV